MSSAEKFYRSSNGVIAGVCAGVADHYGTDALPIRLLFVLLLCTSLGLFGIVYLFLMLRWPRKAPDGTTFEVSPHAVDSYAFGSLSDDAISRMRTIGRHRRADAPLSVGHTPPVPPQSFVALYGTESAPYFRYRRKKRDFADAAAAAAHPLRQDLHGERRRSAVSATFLLLAAVFLLTVFIDFVASRVVPSLDPAASLPNFFVVLGICVILVPSRFFPVTCRAATGMGLVLLGAFLLDVSCGILSSAMLQQPPIIVAMAAMIGLCALSCALRRPWAAALALLSATAFGIMAFLVLPVPGTLNTLSAYLPGLGVLTFDVNPWLG